MAVFDLRENAYQQMQMAQQLGQNIGIAANGMRKMAVEKKLTGIMANKNMTDQQRFDAITNSGGLWYVSGQEVQQFMQRPEVKQRFMQANVGQQQYAQDYQQQAQQRLANMQTISQLESNITSNPAYLNTDGTLNKQGQNMLNFINEQKSQILPEMPISQVDSTPSLAQAQMGQEYQLGQQKLQMNQRELDALASATTMPEKPQSLNQLEAWVGQKAINGEPLNEVEQNLWNSVTSKYEITRANEQDQYFRPGTVYMKDNEGKITVLQQPEDLSKETEKTAKRLQAITSEWQKAGQEMPEQAKTAAQRVENAIQTGGTININDVEAMTPKVTMEESDAAVTDLVEQLKQLRVEIEKNKDVQGLFGGTAGKAQSLIGTEQGQKFAALQSKIKDIALTYAKAKQGGRLSDQDFKVAEEVIGSLYRDYRSNIASIDTLLNSLETKIGKKDNEPTNSDLKQFGITLPSEEESEDSEDIMDFSQY